MSLYNFKIQVPRKIPDTAIEDTMGRKWNRASQVESDFDKWDIEEEKWFVWFKKKELVPEEGEIVEFSDDEYVVSQVYHYARVNRAIVIFNE